MNWRALFGLAAPLRLRTHRIRRLATALTAAVLAGALTFSGVPLASADEAVDPAAATAETTLKDKQESANDAGPSTPPEEKKPAADEPKDDKPEADKPEADKPGNDPTSSQTKAGDPPASDEPGTSEPAKEQLKGDAQPDPGQRLATKSPSEETETGAPDKTPQDKSTKKPDEPTKKPDEPTTGTLMVVKAILPAGSNDLKDAAPGGAGWKFTVSSSTATVGEPSSASTGADSSVSFLVTPAEGRLAPVTVTEKPQDGYSYVKTQCLLVDSKQTPVAHTQLNGASFKVDVKTKKTTVCVVFNRLDEKPLKALKAKKTANPLFDRDFDWAVEKSVVGEGSAQVVAGESASFEYRVVATPSAAQDSNFRVTGTITVTNPNKVAVPVTVTDDLGIDGATCAIADADNVIVPASGTLVLTYECQLSQATASTSGKNTAVVSWEGGSVTATASFAFTPESATVTDRTVQLSDTAGEFGGTRTLDALDGPQTFTYSRTLGAEVAGGTCETYPNTASIGETTDQPELTDDAEVKVCADEEPLKALKAKKTANPLFDRDFDWAVEKSVVGEGSAQVVAGESASFEYRVVVTPSAAQDGNFRVTGTITVTNPNKVAVPVTVTDDLGIDGATCVVADAAGAVVPASGSLTLTYECELSQATASTAGKNTAVVSWDGGSVTATASFAFTAESATVTDRFVQLSDTAQEFGGTRTLDALDGPQSFTYSRVLGSDVIGGSCQVFPNTASIGETTDQSELTDDAEVKVCADEEVVEEPDDEAVLGETDEEGDTEPETDVLANTGSETDGLLGLAGLTVAGGALLLWLGRRRLDEDAAA